MTQRLAQQTMQMHMEQSCPPPLDLQILEDSRSKQLPSHSAMAPPPTPSPTFCDTVSSSGLLVEANPQNQAKAAAEVNVLVEQGITPGPDPGAPAAPPPSSTSASMPLVLNAPFQPLAESPSAAQQDHEPSFWGEGPRTHPTGAESCADASVAGSDVVHPLWPRTPSESDQEDVQDGLVDEPGINSSTPVAQQLATITYYPRLGQVWPNLYPQPTWSGTTPIHNAPEFSARNGLAPGLELANQLHEWLLAGCQRLSSLDATLFTVMNAFPQSGNAIA